MKLRRKVSAQLRRSDNWVTLRRLQHEGLRNAYHRWMLWREVLKLPGVKTEIATPAAPVEVHLVCRQTDHLCALWALKSFYSTAGVRYPLVIHLNGTFTRTAVIRLHRHLPCARLVPGATADQEVARMLSGSGTRLLDARARSPFMRKIVDVALMSKGKKVLLLDSDVLFFRCPTEVLDACERKADEWLFQRDVATTYNLSPKEALEDLGITLADQINTGIVVFPREQADLMRCEQYLAHPKVSRATGWIEQTLYALLASEQRRVKYLPANYLVSLGRADLGGLIARHYAGPSRPLLTAEGIPFLLGQRREKASSPAA